MVSTYFCLYMKKKMSSILAPAVVLIEAPLKNFSHICQLTNKLKSIIGPTVAPLASSCWSVRKACFAKTLDAKQTPEQQEPSILSEFSARCQMPDARCTWKLESFHIRWQVKFGDQSWWTVISWIVLGCHSAIAAHMIQFLGNTVGRRPRLQVEEPKVWQGVILIVISVFPIPYSQIP